MQLSLFNESKNENNIITVKNMKELNQVLTNLKNKDLVFFKNREISKDKFFEVRYKNNYEEIFYNPKQIIEFLTDEQTWLERKYSPKKKRRKNQETREKIKDKKKINLTEVAITTADKELDNTKSQQQGR